MGSIVSIANCNEYDFLQVKEAIVKSLEPLGGIRAFAKPGQTVLLKPNALGAFAPEDAVTTHPFVVKAVVQLVKEAKARPMIAESCGVGANASSSRALKESGIKGIAEEEGIDCFPLETRGFERMSVGGKEFFVSRAFLDADVVISLPKLKTHALTIYTGAIKNSFAIVPTSERRRAHNKRNEADFCEEMTSIFSARKPELVIMDAVVAMEGLGPVGGKKRRLCKIIASNDAVALDAIVCDTLGFGEINTLKKAKQKKLGETNLKKIKVFGRMQKAVFERPFVAKTRLPAFFGAILYGFLKVRPVVKKLRCKRCGICAKHCPANAIEMRKFPEINRSKCICCFCCAELCPEQAIKIEVGKIGRALIFAKGIFFRFFENFQKKKPKKSLI